jgi:hypothetical protein
MHRGLALCLSPSLTLVVGCGENDVLCAPLANWAVAVDVRDSVTDALVVSEARGRCSWQGYSMKSSPRPPIPLVP